MKVCPQCKAAYEDAIAFCGRDGSPLRSLGATLPEGHRLDSWSIAGVLRQGGFGTVYRALASDGSVCAIKVLHTERLCDAEAVARFRQEVAVGGVVRHPGVVRILHAGADAAAGPFVVMNLLDGESVGDHLARTRTLPWPLWGTVLEDAAAALLATHAAGVVHRDVKPDNLLLATDATRPGGVRATLVDFGVARFIDVAAHGHVAQAVRTMPSQIVGSPGSMAPEQILGGRIDERTDVYGLGCTLYEIVTGHPPFVHSKAGQVLRAHVYDVPEPPSTQPGCEDLPPAFDELVIAMLAKKASQRVESMAGVLSRWEQVRGAVERAGNGSAQRGTGGAQ
ncbi:MAG: serine/threonine protein kinase [Myxococcales bacterium]|nr:serine/threonine protein kinase [Myxococcales bacterium]